jgi:hypothetical protein
MAPNVEISMEEGTRYSTEESPFRAAYSSSGSEGLLAYYDTRRFTALFTTTRQVSLS